MPAFRSFRATPRVALLLFPVLALTVTTSCQSHHRSAHSGAARSSNETSLRAPSGPRVFSTLERAVALATLRHWAEKGRDPTATYELDAFDRRITASFRAAVKDIFPAVVPGESDEALLLTVTLDRVEFPVGNYAYVTLRISNRFEAQEYADVFQLAEGNWQLIDHYLVANTILGVVFTEFSWPGYCLAHGIAMPTDTPPATP